MTPIGSRLFASLNDEYLRMQNEWFFKWHHIGGQRAVEIDSFRGRPIVYGGIKFSGSARLVYWDTIQYYLRNKIGSIFDSLEGELPKFPLEIRAEALNEARWIVGQFAEKVQTAATEKDRILRGDGIKFPPEDTGQWRGWHSGEIEARVEALHRIYCNLKQDVGGVEVLQSLMRDKVSLVKKDGAVFRTDISATVSTGQITTFAADLPIEVGDHFLRDLPNGLVDDYIVIDPGYHSGIAGAIQPHYQVKVRRSDAPSAPPQTIIANFHGANSRMNVNSSDNSVNVVLGVSAEHLAGFISQVRASMSALPAEHQEAIAEPLAVLETEARNEAPSRSKIHAALLMIRRIVEGASGNLVASGIMELIRRMTG
jgi:hypothetical protein